MNVDTLRAQLEVELSWRSDEITFFHNQCLLLESLADQNRFRRALVLILYSHLEGFFKFALDVYVEAINSERISCTDAASALVAATLSDLLKALRDPNSKCEEFRNQMPEDTKLHVFGREREFVERIDGFMGRVVKLPEGLIDTESNLKPIVIKKNLFKLGLPYRDFERLDSDIWQLLLKRNKIAHGETRDGIDQLEYERLSRAAFSAMTGIMIGLTRAVNCAAYLKVN